MSEDEPSWKNVLHSVTAVIPGGPKYDCSKTLPLANGWLNHFNFFLTYKARHICPSVYVLPQPNQKALLQAGLRDPVTQNLKPKVDILRKTYCNQRGQTTSLLTTTLS